MKLTVLIPIYNTEPSALIESVYSIVGQDDGIKHEIILINDGSTKYSTKRAIDFLGAEFYDRLQVIDKPNGGTSDALNAGHALVKTEYVALQGSDDVSDRSRFRLQCEYLRANPNTDVLGTNLFAFYDDDITRAPIFITKARDDNRQVTDSILAKDWWTNHGTVIYRNTAVLDSGGYTTQGRAQDVNLWRTMVNKGYTIKNITPILYGWRRYRK